MGMRLTLILLLMMSTDDQLLPINLMSEFRVAVPAYINILL